MIVVDCVIELRYGCHVMKDFGSGTASARATQRTASQSSRDAAYSGDRPALIKRGHPSTLLRVNRGRQTLKLPNEANFSGWVCLWISLVDNWLTAQVRQFVAWLRLPELGSFLRRSGPFTGRFGPRYCGTKPKLWATWDMT
jgi:hypothetical protein